MPKPATDLANDKSALVTERPTVWNENPTIHSTEVVTCVFNQTINLDSFNVFFFFVSKKKKYSVSGRVVTNFVLLTIYVLHCYLECAQKYLDFKIQVC